MTKYITSSFCLDGGCVGLYSLEEPLTSSFCAKGECVGLLPANKPLTSSFCQKGECVSVEADTTDRQYLLIADTKPENTLPPLRIDHASYESFWQSVLDGDYDLEKLSATPVTSQGAMPVSVRLSDESDCNYPILLGVLCGCAETDRYELSYDRTEWQAFIDGVKNDELSADIVLGKQPATV